MDLVAAYGSEEEVEEGKSTEYNTDCHTNMVDFINLAESDQEDQNPAAKERISAMALKNNLTIRNDQKQSLKYVDCIDISDDDVESCSNTLPITSNGKLCETKCNAAIPSEKTDYLNISECDEEEEHERAENYVNNLMRSAAVLNELSCGPVKSMEQFEQHRPCSRESGTPTASSCSTPHSRTSYNVVYDRTRNTPELARSPDTSYDYALKDNSTIVMGGSKRFKRDTSSLEISDNLDDTSRTSEELSVSSSHMYRKDMIGSDGHLKNVVCRIPRQIRQTYIGHTNVVTALNWCVPQYSHLLLSASADCTLKIWDMFCKNPVQCLKNNSGLKAAKWSLDGERVIAGGYGKKAHVFDVSSGKEIVSYNVYYYLTSMDIHPYMDDVFLCGTRHAILGYDLRVNSNLPIRTFFSNCGEVLDIAFLDENEFICSTNVVGRDSADRTIMAWDFSSGAILSNQIYLERYTCPSLKVHPSDSSFVAQTNGDYIASFSTVRPYKIKNKRYVGHKVSGFGIECDISPDGKYLASGDASGDLYLYNYVTTNVIHKITAKPNVPVNRIKWHPTLSSTIATATWDGHLQIWK